VLEHWIIDTTTLNGVSPTWGGADGTAGAEAGMWTNEGCGVGTSAASDVLDYVDVDAMIKHWIVYDIPLAVAQDWIDGANYGLIFSTSETWPVGLGAARERSFYADSSILYMTFGDTVPNAGEPVTTKYIRIRK
jgi:hypothetical protein